jgi:hypothetical protein
VVAKAAAKAVKANKGVQQNMSREVFERQETMKSMNLKIVVLGALLGTVLLTGCAGPKAPAWPEGDLRPINADIQVKKNAGGN